MAQKAEMSVYLNWEDKQAVEDAAAEAGYSSASAYVRSHLPECSDE